MNNITLFRRLEENLTALINKRFDELEKKLKPKKGTKKNEQN